jgi:hypothetical protein
MRVVLRVVTVLALLLASGARAELRAGAGEVDPALRHRVERHFQVLPVRGGVVLTPKTDSGVKTIEIREGVIALDGDPATGAELREKLGADAELVLQVSYLPADALAQWGQGAKGAKGAQGAKGEEGAASETPEAAEPPELPPVPEAPEDSHMRKSAARVHIGSDILVAEDELVTDPVVAVGGSVTVLGRVNDDVVAVGGSVHLGPKAVVRGDVTSVGGRIDQTPGATVQGRVNEVRIGPPHFHFNPAGFFGPLAAWNPFTGWFKLFGTLLRLGLITLLAMLVALVAARPVERIGLRALQEPWLSGFTGLLAQLLFVPVLVLTVVILAVSLIGIPLLVLVPFGVIAFLLAVLIGFTGVALRLGRWAVGPDRPMFVAMAVGIILVAVVTLVARVLALVPAPLWPLTWMIGLLGFLVEYVAWSVGLGAALLSRFGTRGAPYDPPVAPPPIPVYDGPSGV